MFWNEWNHLSRNKWNQLFEMSGMCVLELVKTTFLKWVKLVFQYEWNLFVKTSGITFLWKWENFLLTRVKPFLEIVKKLISPFKNSETIEINFFKLWKFWNNFFGEFLFYCLNQWNNWYQFLKWWKSLFEIGKLLKSYFELVKILKSLFSLFYFKFSK